MSEADPVETVVALVVLKPASGRTISGDAVLTAQTGPEFAPSPGDVAFVRERLSEAGFEVGPLGGIAMAISAARSRFERYFSNEVAISSDGGWVWKDAGGRETRELPSASVPNDIAGRVQTVTFEEPAEPVEALAPWP